MPRNLHACVRTTRKNFSPRLHRWRCVNITKIIIIIDLIQIITFMLWVRSLKISIEMAKLLSRSQSRWLYLIRIDQRIIRRNSEEAVWTTFFASCCFLRFAFSSFNRARTRIRTRTAFSRKRNTAE